MYTVKKLYIKIHGAKCTYSRYVYVGIVFVYSVSIFSFRLEAVFGRGKQSAASAALADPQSHPALFSLCFLFSLFLCVK